jgi:hypothetical protein
MVRFLAGEGNLYLYQSVQLGSGAHQAYSIVSSGEGKATAALSLPLTFLLSAEVKNGGVIPPQPHMSSCHGQENLYLYLCS